ncbi:hypothetical protein [Saccharothrix longispora]|uniref:hypothetical protein n=1 Tax=Saccharothrix longispora TaxID=33920 RepID=UPI0028FD567A|nr:hypothetical protein [Saccharothrix longispora]MBY8850170.1 hypothetical protein [Saccharothrix sp. MB29]MDU0293415.1 hypothetical protein [Saccharothrix longispora]
MTGLTTLHPDETGVRTNAEQRLHGIAAVVTPRREYAEIITRLSLEGAFVVVETTAPRQRNGSEPVH